LKTNQNDKSFVTIAKLLKKENTIFEITS